MSDKDIINLMDENRYMNSDEAKKLGFVDSIENENTNAGVLLRIAAMDVDRKQFHLPPLPGNMRPRHAAALAALKRF